MLRLNKAIIFAAVAFPFLISVLSVIFGNEFLLLICAAAIIIEIIFIPQFDGRENLWMFVIVAVAGLPVNIAGAVYLNNIDFFGFSDFPFMSIVTAIIVFCVFFSIEQIVFGVLARFIRPVQHRISL